MTAHELWKLSERPCVASARALFLFRATAAVLADFPDRPKGRDCHADSPIRSRGGRGASEKDRCAASGWRTRPGEASEGIGGATEGAIQMMACRSNGDAVRMESRMARRGPTARELRVAEPIAEESLRAPLASGAIALSCAPLWEQRDAQGHMLVEQRTIEAEGVSSDARGALEAEAKRSTEARAEIVAELYKSSYHRVFAFARRLVSDDDAEEIAHESFVRLLRVRNLERMQISVAYLLRIAENLIRRRHGRAQRYREVLEQSGRMVPECGERLGRPDSGGTSGLRSHSARRGSEPCAERGLDELLRLLTPAEHSAVRLIVCEGLDYQAAACSLGVPVSTINNWKHRALTKLKNYIGSELDGPVGRLSSRAG